MKYSWILFDADNTLFDFTHASRLAFNQCMQEIGLVSKTDLYPTYKKINASVWKRLEDGEINLTQLRSLRFQLFLEAVGKEADPLELNNRYLQHLIGYTELLEETLPLLDQLKGKYQMAIITNGLKEVQRPRISKLGLTPYFETIVVSDEIGMAKPDPAYFDYTFEQIGRPAKSEVLVVGDSLNSDIRGAIQYELDSCWYNPEQKTGSDEIKPSYEIHKLGDLMKILTS